jgi:cullin-4
MTSVFLLLSLPNTSEGFTTVRPSALEPSLDDGSASPPRKVARLSAESDSASASRSKGKGAAVAPRKSGAPIAIKVVGEYSMWVSFSFVV